jgi:hypothetical protein
MTTSRGQIPILSLRQSYFILSEDPFIVSLLMHPRWVFSESEDGSESYFHRHRKVLQLPNPRGCLPSGCKAFETLSIIRYINTNVLLNLPENSTHF